MDWLLNVVDDAMRSVSARSATSSELMLARSESEIAPFAAWTVSSRMRWTIDSTAFRAPSAVWSMDTASWTLRPAWLGPRTWPRSFSLIARPAASSAARLMRRPLERRSTLFANAPAVMPSCRCAFIASMFVLIRVLIDLASKPDHLMHDILAVRAGHLPA